MLGTHTLPPLDKYDFVILGAGAAGCALAARLSEDPSATVLLLEAGGHGLDFESRVPVAAGKLQHTALTWNEFAEPQPGRACESLIDGKSYWPRGKGIGGSSLVNYLAYVRGNKADYDSWAKITGDEKWSYKNVLPVFKRMEGRTFDHPVQCDKEFHGTDGPLTTALRVPSSSVALKFVEAAKSLGHKEGDYNGAEQERVGLLQQVTRSGARCSAGIAYIWPNLHRPNLHVVTGAQATRVLFDSNKRAMGAEFKSDSDGKLHRIDAAKEVIVSCSAVGSPVLLTASGIGPADELARHGISPVVINEHVGKHLEDHLLLLLPIVGGPACVDAVNARSAELMPSALPELVRWLTRGEGHLSSTAYDATLFYKTDQSQFAPDAQIGLFAAGGNRGLWVDNCRWKFEPPEAMIGPDGQGFTMVPALLHPHSTGKVTLKDKASGAPVIEAGYFSDQRDLDRMAAIAKHSYEIAMAMGNYTKELFVPDDLRGMSKDDPAFWKAFAKKYASTIYHPCSTCKMGLVVDSNLAVKGGVSGLRVVDASVFPHNVSGNTYAASVLIGEVASDIIASAHGLKLGKPIPPMSTLQRWSTLGLAALYGGGERSKL